MHGLQAGGTLANLRCLVWPLIPADAADVLRRNFQHVPIVTDFGHPALQPRAWHRLPQSADPSFPLDDPFLEGIAQFDLAAAATESARCHGEVLKTGSKAGRGQPGAVPEEMQLNLAERFRCVGI